MKQQRKGTKMSFNFLGQFYMQDPDDNPRSNKRDRKNNIKNMNRNTKSSKK